MDTNTMKTFDTTIIDLASAILTEISESRLIGIDRERRINGKDVIQLEYPEEHCEAVMKIQEDFDSRALMVDLYNFNANRRFIRNQLFKKGKF